MYHCLIINQKNKIMRKLLYLFLVLPLLFSSCAKEEGCQDALATNYNADAEEDDGSCTYSLAGYWDVDSYVLNGTEYMGSAIAESYIIVNSDGTTESNTLYLIDNPPTSVPGTMSISGTTMTWSNTDSGDVTIWTITLFNGSNLNINCADLGGLGSASMRLTK